MSEIYFQCREIIELQHENQVLKKRCEYYEAMVKKLREELSNIKDKENAPKEVCVKSV